MGNSTDKKSRLIFAYDILFCVLALVAVYFSICDMTTGCTSFQRNVDTAITIVFIADYFLRLVIARHKKEFFKEAYMRIFSGKSRDYRFLKSMEDTFIRLYV